MPKKDNDQIPASVRYNRAHLYPDDRPVKKSNDERNKPVNTPAGRARYADAAPDIKPRQAEGEGKMRFAVAGPSDVETREERTGRRIAETEAKNLNESYRKDKPKVEEKTQERVKKYKRDPYGDA
jgi:hypothetical protein